MLVKLRAALRAAQRALGRLRDADPPSDMPGPDSPLGTPVALDLSGLTDNGIDELAARLMAAAVSSADDAVGRLLHQAARDVTDEAITRTGKRFVRWAEQAAAEAAGDPP